MISFLVVVLAGSLSHGSERERCTPAYAILDKSIKIPAGASELKFKLLAVGCEESLRSVWPPKIDELQKELTTELQEPHPVQILFLIRERSPELRQRITRKLNKVLGKPVAYDVFLFDAKTSE